jgi:hypothetical protein
MALHNTEGDNEKEVRGAPVIMALDRHLIEQQRLCLKSTALFVKSVERARVQDARRGAVRAYEDLRACGTDAETGRLLHDMDVDTILSSVPVAN